MKNRNHGLSEKEMELVQLLMADCETTGDIQAKLKLTTFFEYPQEIRKIIYTTNAVKGYHRMVRKFTKSKAIFSTDDLIRKIIFTRVKEISKKWTMPVRVWGLAYSQLAIFFEDRFAA